MQMMPTISCLLDELREDLWVTYGAEIIEQRQQKAQQQHEDSDEVDDVIDFKEPKTS